MSTRVESTIDYQSRRQNARKRMSTQGLNGILLTGGPNLSYLTGVSDTLGVNSGSRPLLYFLPATGTPCFIAHRFHLDEILERYTDTHIETYEQLSLFPQATLQTALTEAGVTEGTVGAELGPEATLSVPARSFFNFTSDLSKIDFVDAQELLMSLRSRKSSPEIERIERACKITSDALDRTFCEINTGMTGAEIESIVCQQMLNFGGRSPWALVTTKSRNYTQTASGGDKYQTAKGDMVWIDCGCTVDEYWSDYSRAGVIGGPTDRQQKAQNAIFQITRDTVNKIEPGVSIARVSREAELAIDSLNLQIEAYLSKQAGRIGHSLGLQVTELPSLNEATDQSFEQGMVVTIEPAFATDYGTFHVEQNIVITNSGTRTLSSDYWKLRNIN